ncbi:MAG TPA: glycerol-3-phosphate dehydrogenase [Allosphingosinicella sp.]|nr:glycerol-3-phosphate dehydrogenase [Allosphingosinicella sp.]
MTIYDLAIVGGGVNGTGIARDAAGRGASVLLLEQGDLAQGTSSASTKLVHGGLRYLEHREFGLVRESLKERERLWRIAPHIIWPMRFVLPHRRGLRPRWLLRLGLFLYDHIGGRRALLATESVDLHTHPAGAPLKRRYTRGYIYSDAWVDDARLVVLNARDAADKGAVIRTRTELIRGERGRDVWRLATGGAAGPQVFEARAMVNAAGPSVLALLERAGRPPPAGMRLVRGSHIVVPKLFDHPWAYFFQLPDTRIFFAIPYERHYTLIGTTDRDHQASPTEARASEEEIAYLCEGVNQYFGRPISPADIVWTYSGVRPLVDDGSGRPEAATRGYSLHLDGGEGGAPLLSVFGGKITTYRHLAEEAVERLAPLLPALSGPPWTADSPLPGGNFPIDGAADLAAGYAADYPFLQPEWIDRLVKAYGTIARTWLGGAGTLEDLGVHFGHGLTGAEVDYLRTREWAVSADDVLWRRTKLGLRLDAAQKAALAAFLDEQGEQP